MCFTTCGERHFVTTWCHSQLCHLMSNLKDAFDWHRSLVSVALGSKQLDIQEQDRLLKDFGFHDGAQLLVQTTKMIIVCSTLAGESHHMTIWSHSQLYDLLGDVAEAFGWHRSSSFSLAWGSQQLGPEKGHQLLQDFDFHDGAQLTVIRAAFDRTSWRRWLHSPLEYKMPLPLTRMLLSHLDDEKQLRSCFLRDILPFARTRRPEHAPPIRLSIAEAMNCSGDEFYRMFDEYFSASAHCLSMGVSAMRAELDGKPQGEGDRQSLLDAVDGRAPFRETALKTHHLWPAGGRAGHRRPRDDHKAHSQVMSRSSFRLQQRKAVRGGSLALQRKSPCRK